jgi:hypothetical protein
MPSEAFREVSFLPVPRGLGGDGERLRRRVESAKLDLKAGSNLGGCATDIREFFFFSRGGEGGGNGS